MKIVFIDTGTISKEIDRAALRKLGTFCEYSLQEVKEQGIISCIGSADIILSGAKQLTNDVLDACHDLKLVVISATGFNSMDVAYARKKGITVCNIPAYGTIPVAQHAIALLLAIANRVSFYSEQVHAGNWRLCKDAVVGQFPLIELAGKTIGIIGFGRIGRTVGQMASGLGMRVIAYDQYELAEGHKIGEYVSLDRLLAESDVISLHCPATPENIGLIHRAAISKMKDGVILINAARGDLLDEMAVAEALKTGKIHAAGLDVLANEPPQDDSPLLYAPNCYITPHIAWATPEGRKRMADAMVASTKAFIDGFPINVIN